MRRALAGVVPEELLHRRRKAFLSRAPLAAVGRGWSDLEAMSRDMRSVSLGLVDKKRFSEALAMARQGQLLFTVAFWRTVAVEAWLRNAGGHFVVADETMRTATAPDTHDRVLS
jgi:asparagine synthase (glutamine-hydrolysing)